MQKNDIFIKIKDLREELGKIYEENMNSGEVNERIMLLSQTLDLLIVEYLKEEKPFVK